MPFGWKVKLIQVSYEKACIDRVLWHDMGWFCGEHTKKFVKVSLQGVTFFVPETHLMVARKEEQQHNIESFYALQRRLCRIRDSRTIAPYLPIDLNVLQYIPMRDNMTILEKSSMESSLLQKKSLEFNFNRSTGKSNPQGESERLSQELLMTTRSWPESFNFLGGGDLIHDKISNNFIHADESFVDLGLNGLIQQKWENITEDDFDFFDRKVRKN